MIKEKFYKSITDLRLKVENWQNRQDKKNMSRPFDLKA